MDPTSLKLRRAGKTDIPGPLRRSFSEASTFSARVVCASQRLVSLWLRSALGGNAGATLGPVNPIREKSLQATEVAPTGVAFSNGVNETNMARIWNYSIKFMTSKHKQIYPVRSKTPMASADSQANRTSNGAGTPLKPHTSSLPRYHSKAGYGAQRGRRKVFVAMSGGVDSSVASALLKKQDLDVTGVFFKPWSPSVNISYCNWKQDRQDAMMAAAMLDIKFKTWDFSKEYGNRVTRYMIDSYRAGITPNPDVMCNKEIKFGLFLKKALAEGADMIATGHYARICKSKIQSSNSKKFKYKLLKGNDPNKDQSYFLYTLTQKELKHCLFPVGEYTKPEVRKLAKKFGLPNHAKKDSQGVCFIGQLDMKQFLKEYIKPKTGEIRLKETNQIIGKHDGIFYYTIGQRHGLDLKIGGGPYYITGKDIKKNIIYVSKNENKLKSRELLTGNITWVNSTPKLPAKISVAIRYRSAPMPAVISKNGNKIAVKFRNPAKAVTSGQSAVFYKKDEVLGGGTIV